MSKKIQSWFEDEEPLTLIDFKVNDITWMGCKIFSTIGTSATIFGIFLGVTFSIYVENIRQFLSSTFDISLFPEEIYFLSKMPSEININSIVIITICSILITIVVSIFPALKAANMDPIKSLKYE